MRILSLNPEPLAEVPYLNAGRGAGDFYEDRLPILEATVDRLPDGTAAILATGDLQFRERFKDSDGGPLRLLGEVLPQRLRREILPLCPLPPGQVGVCLAGDFYTVPALDKRGGSGDVTNVWDAFAESFDWVAGVAGNHDTFGPSTKPPAWLRNLQRVRYLDGDCARHAELKFGGVGGIIGNPRKPQRRTETDYLHALESVLLESPDILLMHDGPNGSEKQRGSRSIRETIEQVRPLFIIRGHAHWDEPLAMLENGTQVLNVDARLVVLRRA